MTEPDVGATVNTWISVVRRARLSPLVKAVALMIATYANPDGTSVYPGLARLAIQCEVSYDVAKRAVRRLRAVGLIERVRVGNRRAGLADEYRLILAADLLDRLDVPDPEAERKAIETLHETDRAASARRHNTRHHGSPGDA